MTGDAEGNIKQLFYKVRGILKKNGPFEVYPIIKHTVHLIVDVWLAIASNAYIKVTFELSWLATVRP